MVEITFISHDLGDEFYYQVQVRSTNGIFGEESNIRPLCFGTSNLLDMMKKTIPIIKHSAANGDIGILLIGKFPYMAYKAITTQVDAISESQGANVYYHQHEFEII